MLDSDTPPEAVRRAVDLSRLKEKGINIIKLAGTQTANLTDKAADGLSEAKDQLFAIEYSKLPQEVLDWIKEHPYQTAFHVVGGVVFFAPGVIATPLLGWLGFSTSGPVAGTFAAAWQARLGIVPASCLFSYLQSAAMSGYGVAPVANAVRGVVGIVNVGVSWLGREGNAEEDMAMVN